MKRLTAKKNDTFETKFAEFINEKRLAGICEKTLSSYANHFHTFQIAPTTPIDSVDWKQIISKIRTKQVSETTKNSYLRSLKVFMKWLGIAELPTIRNVETVKELYTDDELRRLLAKPKAGASFSEIRTHSIVSLILDTGLRAASIRNIKCKDIDLANRLAYITHTKTRKVQIVPFSPTTCAAIAKYIRIRDGKPDDYLFCSVYDSKFTENGLAEAVRLYNTGRGVSKTSTHLLRHCFSRLWIINGGDAFTLQTMLNHSGLEMTRHYCQLYNQDIINNYKSPVETIQRKYLH